MFSFADGIVRCILERLGSETVESIFVSGSAARGDVAAFSGPDGVEIYSDLDLFVVVRDPRGLEETRRRARRAAADVSREGEGYRIFPEPDVGVFSEDDLLSQKPRPGTVEIAGSHVVLHGNHKTPIRTGRFSASAIDASEGLYLIENRLAEVSGLSDRIDKERSDGCRRYLFYVLSKSCLDAVTAMLIALGRFHPSREERMKRFREARSRGECSRFLAEGSVSHIERCYGSLNDLQMTLESGDVTPGFRSEVESVLLGAWMGIAKHASSLGTEEWSELLDWRCKRGRWLGNSRELWVLAGRMGGSRAGVLFRCRTLARFSPVDALRLSGMVEVLLRRRDRDTADGAPRMDAIEKGYVAAIDGLTRAFGYGTGPVFQRARRLFGEAA